MDTVGLIPSSTAGPGGKRVGQRMSHYIAEEGFFAAAYAAMPEGSWFPWLCREEAATGAKSAKRKSKTKYSCGCGTNIWGKPGLEVMCPACDRGFAEAA